MIRLTKILLIILFFATIVNAQKSADVMILNPQVNNNHFTWEVHLKPTNDWGGNFSAALGDCSLFFEFNTIGLANPVLVYQSPVIDSAAGYTNTIEIVGNRVGITTNLNFPAFFGVPLTMGVSYHLFTVKMEIVTPQGFSNLYWDPLNTGIFNALDEVVETTYLGDGNLSLQGTTGFGGGRQIFPRQLKLYPNYPNPFNPETVIRYEVPGGMDGNRELEVVIYNNLGSPVRTLYRGSAVPGIYQIRWDGRNDRDLPVSGGVYICRLRMGRHTEAQRMILVR